VRSGSGAILAILTQKRGFTQDLRMKNRAAKKPRGFS
jgi:hypothetical protein